MEANGVSFVWWTDRSQEPQYYWTNVTESSHMCSCGLDDSCVEHQVFDNVCNCDANLPVQVEDAGA